MHEVIMALPNCNELCSLQTKSGSVVLTSGMAVSKKANSLFRQLVSFPSMSWTCIKWATVPHFSRW